MDVHHREVLHVDVTQFFVDHAVGRTWQETLGHLPLFGFQASEVAFRTCRTVPGALTLASQALIDMSDVVAALRRAGIGGPLEVAQRRRAPNDQGVEGEQFPAVSHPKAVELPLVMGGQTV